MAHLELDNITVRFGGLVALSELSFSINSGEIVGLIGPNGADKSCLLRLLAGLNRPRCGVVQMADKPLLEMSPQERAKQIAWLAQQGELHHAAQGRDQQRTLDPQAQPKAERGQGQHQPGGQGQV